MGFKSPPDVIMNSGKVEITVDNRKTEIKLRI